MSTDELKINIINQITKLEDIRIVEEIQQLLNFELDKTVYNLSAQQKVRISEARQEVAMGKILSEKEANDEIESWLNGK